MPDDFATRVSGIGALAEPARRALYDFVVAAAEPVSREQAADGVGVPLHSAKFHLDRLVAEGLLEVEFRRLTGRTGPGAGRPSKLYRRARRQVTVSLPDRRYDLAGEILASAVDRAGAERVPVDLAVREAAEQAGRRAGSAAGSAGDCSRVLAAHGYEPRSRGEEILLGNCPFDALVREHTRLVCGLNQCFIGGVLDGLGCGELEAVLDPEPGLCCVKVRPRPSASPG